MLVSCMSEIIRVFEQFFVCKHIFAISPIITGYNRFLSVFDELKIKVSIGIKKEKEGLSWF